MTGKFGMSFLMHISINSSPIYGVTHGSYSMVIKFVFAMS